jgi:hypothetical protein
MGARPLAVAHDLVTAGTELTNVLNTILEPVAETYGGWELLHRGIHLSGHCEDLPCVFHIHTGDRATGYHKLKLETDFPDQYGGGRSAGKLAVGYKAQLFNGFNEFFNVIGTNIAPLRDELEAQFDVSIPAPTLYGQYSLDLAIVQFAAGLLRAAERSPQVSTDVDGFAFSQEGRFAYVKDDVSPPLRSRSSELRGSTTASIHLDAL